jgi:eukaryotic-like serine/threonine-protein kinase
MRQENWQQAKEIFYSALHKTGDERKDFLAEACRGDASLFKDVQGLLDSYQTGYLETPILNFHESQSTTPAAAYRFKAGDQINHYKIVRLLGRGGMGEVYLASDERLDRFVAVKTLYAAAGELAEKRLLREARSVAKLNHPNICSIYEVGETADFPFIVMQYVEGQTLDEYIANRKPSASESIAIILQVSAGLEEAHAHGIIHRDIKPSNIIIDSKGRARVLDFSLAKRVFTEAGGKSESALSEIGVVAGTIAYMSPEQARGQELDARSDIWSLGVVLFEMLTGRQPFHGQSKNDVIAAILTKQPPRIADEAERFSVEIERIIDRMLEKNRDLRYGAVADFLADLTPLKDTADDIPLSTQLFQTNGKFVPVSVPATRIPTLDGAAQITNEESADKSVRLPAPKVRRLVIAAAAFVVVLAAVGAFMKFYGLGQATAPDVVSRLKPVSLFSVENKPDGALSEISFSPDGRYIVFGVMNDGTSSIYVRLAAGEKSVRLTDGSLNERAPVWSPDGTRVAFLAEKNGVSGIWTLPYIGGVPSLQTTLPEDAKISKLLKWSSDLAHIYCQSGNRIGKLNLSNGQITYINLPDLNYLGDFAVSGDEQKLAFNFSRNKKKLLGIYSMVTRETKQIPINEGKLISPVWFPDNNEVAYSSDQSGLFQIYEFDTVRNQSSQLTSNNYSSTNPIVSPDGSTIGYLLVSSFNNN